MKTGVSGQTWKISEYQKKFEKHRRQGLLKERNHILGIVSNIRNININFPSTETSYEK